jgi:hypothetical protein
VQRHLHGPSKPRVVTLWKLKHLNLAAWYRVAADTITVGSWLAQSLNDLIARLNAGQCEACGGTVGPFEMHYLRALKDKASEPFTVLKRSARQRKTTVLCHRCHVAIHAGRMASRAESRVR